MTFRDELLKQQKEIRELWKAMEKLWPAAFHNGRPIIEELPPLPEYDPRPYRR